MDLVSCLDIVSLGRSRSSIGGGGKATVSATRWATVSKEKKFNVTNFFGPEIWECDWTDEGTDYKSWANQSITGEVLNMCDLNWCPVCDNAIEPHSVIGLSPSILPSPSIV